MKVYGLTGGIASGKTTVGAMFKAHGVAFIDADEVAREVVASGTPGLAAVAARFPGVVDAAGALDRARLGDRIFAAPAERAALEAITHPLIRARVLEKTLAFAEAGEPRVIYDAPLLIERRLHEGMNGVVLVWVPRAVQRERLMRRNGLTGAEADARLQAQLPLDDKRPFATWLIDNSGTLDETRAQVDRVWAALCAG